MSEIRKAARVEKQAVGGGELALINRQSLKELAAEEVFTFRVAACDNQVDRDNERFDDEALAEMAKRYVGRPVISDHRWSASGQTARIYAAEVERDGEAGRLVVRAYMLRSEETKGLIAAIEGGILREVSVGARAAQCVCSICGESLRYPAKCAHKKGETYDGALCVGILRGITDVYELSFVAVPAQPAAGVVKQFGVAEADIEALAKAIAGAITGLLPGRGEDTPPEGEPESNEMLHAAKALALERIRYNEGGTL